MWLVWLMPAAVVVAGISMVMVAVESGSDAVPTEVRRTAQVQTENIAPDRLAIELGIRGTLEINPDTGAVTVALANVPADTHQLHLDLIHLARAHGDKSLTLVRGGEQFHGRLDATALQVWAVRLSAMDGSWRVIGRFDPSQPAAALVPALSEGR